MIRIAVLDDEIQEVELLNLYFKRFGAETNTEFIVENYVDEELFLKEFDASYDLICLDIEMPNKDGIELAKEIRKKDSDVLIIFVTNLAQMAIRGYEVHAIDFLIKPVQYYSICMKMHVVLQMIKNKKVKSFFVSTNSGFEKIYTDKLLYVEIKGHYLFFHTTNSVVTQRGSMVEIESVLQDFPFKRCNNCYLVNLKYVDTVEKNELKIGGEWLKISRPRKKEFLQALTNYIGGVE